MKKSLLFLITFSLLSISCYSQPTNTTESNQLKKEITDSIGKLKKQITDFEYKLRVSDSVVKNNLKVLANSIESTKKSIDDTRLRESLKSAEKTISFQNSFIQIFGVIFSTIALLAGFFYFFSINPLIKQANKALERANLATDKFGAKIIEFDKQVDDKINNRFESYKRDLKEKEINEIFKDIESNLENQRRIQIERLTRGDLEINADKIDRLFNVLDAQNLPEYDKKTLLEVLIQKNSFQIKNYFAIWKNVKKEEVIIIDLLYCYYINNGIERFLAPITHFIIARIDPHIEFNRLIDMLPSHPECIMVLINCKSLVSSLENQSRKSVINHLDENMRSWIAVERGKVEMSYLYQKD